MKAITQRSGSQYAEKPRFPNAYVMKSRPFPADPRGLGNNGQGLVFSKPDQGELGASCHVPGKITRKAGFHHGSLHLHQ